MDISFGRTPILQPAMGHGAGWLSRARSSVAWLLSSCLPGARLPPRGQGTNLTQGKGPVAALAWGKVCLSSEHLPRSGPGTPHLGAAGTQMDELPQRASLRAPLTPAVCSALLELSRTDPLRVIRGVSVCCLSPCLKRNLPNGSLGVPEWCLAHRCLESPGASG